MSMSKTIGWMGTLATLLLVPSLFGPVARYRLHAAPVAVATPTYTKDVAPILQRSCENCHRAGGGAPMSLSTYEEVRPWARAIKQRTGIGPHAGVMPPWYMEKNIGIQKYKDDPVAERRGGRHYREVGRQRRPARQPGRHAASAGSTRQLGLAYRHAGSHRQDQGHRRQGGLAGLVGRNRAGADPA